MSSCENQILVPNDLSTIPNPPPGEIIIGYDSDGVLSQKDSNGLITPLGTQIPGPQGFQGLRGFQGYDAIGVQGYDGYQGPIGYQGVQGFIGSIGPDGNTGPQGLRGFQGYQGIKGDNGTSGTDGSDGQQGYQGHQGLKGDDGFIGSDGYQGTQGLRGFQGYQGIKGDNGNSGTDGSDGQQGYQGYQGHQGLKGDDGQQGSQGPISTSPTTIVVAGSNILITGSGSIIDPYVVNAIVGTAGDPVQGPIGYQGLQGPQGVEGSNGPQGISGTNGNQGPIGNTGDTGPQGISGTNGNQGPIGYQGAAGTGGTSSNFLYTTIAELRANSSPSTTNPYFITDSGQEGFFSFTSSSIPENGATWSGTILRSADNKRFVRQFDGTLDIRWFGGVADCVIAGTAMNGTDNSPALNRMMSVASNGQRILVPYGEWLFASPVTTWTNSKVYNLEIQGNTWHPGTTFIKVVNSSRVSRFKHTGTAVAKLGIPTFSRDTYLNGTGPSFSTFTGNFLELQDSHKGDYEMNLVEGFDRAIKLVGGYPGQNGGQENSFRFKYLNRNNIGISLESIDGTSYLDKNRFIGGRISGHLCISMDGNISPTASYPKTGAFRANVFENILLEYGINGIIMDGECTYNNFSNCKIEAGTYTGLWGPSASKIYISNNSTSNYLNGFELIHTDWLQNPGKNLNISGSYIGAGEGGWYQVGQNAIGGMTAGRTTIISSEGISDFGRTLLPNNLDLITFLGYHPTAQTPHRFVKARVNGIEKDVDFKGSFVSITSGGTYSLVPPTGTIRLNAGSANITLLLDPTQVYNGSNFNIEQLGTGSVKVLNSNTLTEVMSNTQITSQGLYYVRCFSSSFVASRIDGTGGGTSSIISGTPSLVDVRLFGGKPDWNGSTGSDNTAAAMAAINATTGGQQIYFAGTGTWYFADNVVFTPPNNAVKYNVVVEGNVLFEKGKGFIIEGNYHSFTSLQSIMGRNTGATLSQYEGTGLLLKNAAHCNIDVKQIERFKYGIKVAGIEYGLTASPKGSQYNIIKYQSIRFNDIQIYITTEGSSSSAGNWSNENTFYGGRLGSGFNGVGGNWGIVQEPGTQSNQNNTFNGNRFYSTGLEGLVNGVKVRYSNQFEMYGGRVEQVIGDVFDFESETTGGSTNGGNWAVYDSKLIGWNIREDYMADWGIGTLFPGCKFSTYPSSGQLSDGLTFYTGAGTGDKKYLHFVGRYGFTSFNQAQQNVVAFGNHVSPKRTFARARIDGVDRYVDYNRIYQNIVQTGDLQPGVTYMRINTASASVTMTMLQAELIDGLQITAEVANISNPFNIVRSDNPAFNVLGTASITSTGRYILTYVNTNGIFRVDKLGGASGNQGPIGPQGSQGSSGSGFQGAQGPAGTGGGTGGGTSYSSINVGSSPNSTGLTINNTNGTIQLQPASSAQPGIVSTSNQTFNGIKTFNGQIILRTGTTASGTAPIKINTATHLNLNPEPGSIEWNGYDLFITDINSIPNRQKILTSDNASVLLNKTWQSERIAPNYGGIGKYYSANNANLTIPDDAYSAFIYNMSANRNLTLPSASSNPDRVLMIGQHSGNGFQINLSVSIYQGGTGGTISTITGNSKYTIQSDGSRWQVIG